MGTQRQAEELKIDWSPPKEKLGKLGKKKKKNRRKSKRKKRVEWCVCVCVFFLGVGEFSSLPIFRFGAAVERIKKKRKKKKVPKKKRKKEVRPAAKAIGHAARTPL